MNIQYLARKYDRYTRRRYYNFFVSRFGNSTKHCAGPGLGFAFMLVHYNLSKGSQCYWQLKIICCKVPYLISALSFPCLRGWGSSSDEITTLESYLSPRYRQPWRRVWLGHGVNCLWGTFRIVLWTRHNVKQASYANSQDIRKHCYSFHMQRG